MNNLLAFFSSVFSEITKNPFVAKYAQPVVMAVLTGASTISIPEGVITVTQSGNPARFTLGSAAFALETFLLTAQTEIQIGSTQIAFVRTAKTATNIVAA